jgi:hypothetical protein
MSIANGISEPADGAQQSAPSSLSETYANVKKYICALPRPFGDMLTEHCHCAAHEDVPDDEVQAPQGLFPPTSLRPIFGISAHAQAASDVMIASYSTFEKISPSMSNHLQKHS